MVLKFFIQLCILSFVVSYTESAGGHSWDYWSHDDGPGNWSQYFPHCNGTRQSPINIETEKAECDENLGNITFTNYGNPTGVNFTALNNGHSFSIGISGYTNETVPWISGGGLPGNFKLVAFHFHWGTHNERGAEHHLNNDSHGCELHMVHMNTKYATVSEAKNKTDGLAVLGIFVDVGKKNDVFENFLNLSVYNVTYPDMSAQVESFAPMSLLPSNKTFYRYNGSLTTPTCDESVTWTVFAHDIVISQEQLNEFRKMMYFDSKNRSQPLQDTHRPVQPLHGRVVKKNCRTPTSPPTTAATAGIAATAGTAGIVATAGTAGIVATAGTAGIAATTATAATVTPTATLNATEPPSNTEKSASNGIYGNIMLVITSLFLVVMPFLKI